MGKKEHQFPQKNAGLKQKTEAKTITLSPASPPTARRTGITNPIPRAQPPSQVEESSEEFPSRDASS